MASNYTNITPDAMPDGSPLRSPGVPASGIRFFYFTFVPTTPTVDVFLGRNIYANEEFITRVMTPTGGGTSILVPANVSNVMAPCRFVDNQISIATPTGSAYANFSTVPNFRMNNLTPNVTHILESRTRYNDRNADFYMLVKSGSTVVPLRYIQTSTVAVVPSVAAGPSDIPLPPPPQAPTGVPAAPAEIMVSSHPQGVRVSWSSVTGAASYEIYKEGYRIGTTAMTHWIDAYVSPGANYTYAVAAVNANGTGPKSPTKSIMPTVAFDNLLPDVSPDGQTVHVGTPVPKYVYYLFTPITSSLDMFLQISGAADSMAILGLYDSAAPFVNLLTMANISNMVGPQVAFGTRTIGQGTASMSITGITFNTSVPYTNTTNVANFRVNNLSADITSPTGKLKTYILELVAYKTAPHGSDTNPQLGIVAKNVGGSGDYTTRFIYNTVKNVRVRPTPYTLSFNFENTGVVNYGLYIYPNMYVFQNVKNVIESIIYESPNARTFNSMYDMSVKFSVKQLGQGYVGQSMLNGWKNDVARSPDFTYEQTIDFNSDNFQDNYFAESARFNGTNMLNGRKNIALFNVLLHEILHGIGVFYIQSYNTSRSDVGWTPYLTNLSEKDPWYRGPANGNSHALGAYRIYCNNDALMRVPVEKDYGEGTAFSHWDEGDTPSVSNEYRYFNGVFHPSLRLETMTGFNNNNDFMTGITAGFLKDYGYTVNMNSPYVVMYPTALVPVIQVGGAIASNNAALRENIASSKSLVVCKCSGTDTNSPHVLYKVNNADKYLSTCAAGHSTAWISTTAWTVPYVDTAALSRCSTTMTLQSNKWYSTLTSYICPSTTYSLMNSMPHCSTIQSTYVYTMPSTMASTYSIPSTYYAQTYVPYVYKPYVYKPYVPPAKQ